MKKVLIVILVLCFAATFFILFKMNEKINEIQTGYDNLSQEVNEHITEMAPLSTDEVETLQHNLDILNEFYGRESMRAEEIANHCFSLKRAGRMESAWIETVTEHTNYVNYYRIEVVTNDGEHYWFEFGYNSSHVYMIHKGENKDTLLYGEVY